MEYFGILNFVSNVPPPFITDRNLFPNIKKETLFNDINKNKIYDILLKPEEVRLDNNYTSSIPILFEHRQNSMLKHIWNSINHGDIVTNRASLKSLSMNDQQVLVEKQWIETDDDDQHQKLIYLVKTKELEEKVPLEKVNYGIFVPTVVFDCPTTNHTFYKYIKTFNEELQSTVHYTCKIDGFLKSQSGTAEETFVPVEFKTLRNPETFELSIDNLYNREKVRIAVQCQISGINDVIFGFRNHGCTSMKLDYCKIPTLTANTGVEKKVKSTLKIMERNLVKVIQRSKYS